MKVYRVSVLCGETGTNACRWFTNKAEAKRVHRRSTKEATDGDTVFAIVQHDIPLNKAGLIEWLNIHGNPDIAYN